ncbi:hypothetical protein L6164_022771 [Bauhinia variegata]|uniref:Uncharacterized protein n=1 Tax=Bauhinia variegata TaxID=167791 RepID=A0ACB9MHI7_BAUVA|nr:hypothetical protein L6164_022771 [Bauhinia variegata]
MMEHQVAACHCHMTLYDNLSLLLPWRLQMPFCSPLRQFYKQLVGFGVSNSTPATWHSEIRNGQNSSPLVSPACKVLDSLSLKDS